MKAIFEHFFDTEITKLLNGNMNFYKKLVDNDKLRHRVREDVFDLIYYEYKKTKKQKENGTDEKK